MRQPSQQVGGQLRQFGALALGENHVPCDALLLKAVDRVHQAIVGGVHVRVVNLLGIAGEHHFGIVTGAADDGLDLVGG